ECGVLPRARTPRPGEKVRAVVPLPLAHPLLLRPPCGSRLSDRARLWEGPSARVRARPPSQEAAARRTLEPRRSPTGPTPGGRTVVRGASEPASDPARFRDRRPPEQDDHAPATH